MAIFFTVRPGVLLKAPVRIARDQAIQTRASVEAHCAVERKILEEIELAIPYCQHANGRSLQSLVVPQPRRITPALHREWLLQTIVAVSHIYSHDIAHSATLRASNILLHDMEIRMRRRGGPKRM
ncbi:hypothetical protein MY5147_001108 [Beauveria neobassiana]